MEIILNGRPHRLHEAKIVADFLVELGFAGRPVLVEINHQALLASEHASTVLKQGDAVEVIQIVAGG